MVFERDTSLIKGPKLWPYMILCIESRRFLSSNSARISVYKLGIVGVGGVPDIISKGVSLFFGKESF